MRPATVRPEAPVTADAGVGEVGSRERGGGGEVRVRLTKAEEAGASLADKVNDRWVIGRWDLPGRLLVRVREQLLETSHVGRMRGEDGVSWWGAPWREEEDGGGELRAGRLLFGRSLERFWCWLEWVSWW